MVDKVQAGGKSESEAATFPGTVWHAELDALAELRRLRRVDGPEFQGESAQERAVAGHATGLAFSGGGIRSATFCLGVAQALAKLGLLRRMDYLSTVSGGGYIGSWLTSWIRNQDFDAVEARLPVEHTKTPQPVGDELATSPVSFLRAFSNYLTPKLGILSADTWAAVATYLRNFILNLLVLLTALSAFLLLPRLFVQAAGWSQAKLGTGEMFLLSAALLLVALAGMGANVISIEAHREAEHRWYASQKWIQIVVALPLFLAGWLLANAFWFIDAGGDSAPPPYLWALVNGFVYFAVWFFVWVILRLRKRGGKELRSHWGWLLGTAPFAGGAGGLLGWLAVKVFVESRAKYFPGEVDQAWSLIHATVFGAPGLVLVFILTAVLHIGLMGRKFDDANREWWSRLGGWLMIYGISWFSFTAMAFYAPVVIIWLGALVATALSAGWLASSIGGILFERRASGGEAAKSPSKLLGVVRALAPQIFVIGLVAVLSFALHVALDARHTAEALAAVDRGASPTLGFEVATTVVPMSEACADFWPSSAAGEGSPQGAGSFTNLMRCHSARAWVTLVAGVRSDGAVLTPDSQPGSWLVPGALLILLASSLLLSWRVDINQFSMHLFYRNRLIRAYLGASNPRREPQEFTGFDSDDDFPFAELEPRSKLRQPDKRPYDGPYHLISANLNLVKGEELAWQQRKGASFLLSPLYTGFAGQTGDTFDGSGFRPTAEYQGEGGISLGMAMAISGAAVSPSMGEGTTSAMAFLLTVFDARLGWWLGNPLDRRPATWQSVGPDVGLFRLLAELTASTDVRSKFVYLSDGGHFENLGIYELVRRRCRLIISADGGADLERTFGGLANAIRKCRSDFGVPISIDLERFRFGQADTYSEVHCAVGTIHYDAVEPGAQNGTLLFLKTALTGDESADVLNYKAANPSFPNQSTADQFFDEAQFESYRALGYHTVEKVFEKLDGVAIEKLSHDELCQALEEAWCPDKSVVATGGGG